MILIADSGSTKTDWTLVDTGGEVAGRYATQGINPFHQHPDVIAGVLNRELIAQLEGREETVAAIYFYGSGCTPEMSAPLIRVLQSAFPASAQIQAESDLLGAARALCGHQEGIACILGTGSNSCYYDGSRMAAHTPALGYILGDEGSGAVLGRLFLNGILKGLLPAALRDEYFRSTGLAMTDIIDRVYRQPLANRFMASSSKFIEDHLSCQPLKNMVVDNFRLFFQHNVLAYQRPELPVASIGSVGYYFREQLSEAAALEGLRLGSVRKSPMDGLILFHSN